MPSVLDLLNRPIVESDIVGVAATKHGKAIRRMVRSYAESGHPVMNGTFDYSNLREGAAQLLTCHPYRLWEYTSVFLMYTPAEFDKVLDVGGAASPLPYYLAELGCDVTATDLQPLLVSVCNDVAGKRALSLTAEVRDVTDTQLDQAGVFQLITCISVLEHIPPDRRLAMLRSIRRLLAPDGIFYLTFDFGWYEESTRYNTAGEQTTAISSIGEFAMQIKDAGFKFVGNDPSDLPDEIMEGKAAPSASVIAARQRLLTPPFDVETPWRSVAGYLWRRISMRARRSPSRYDHHTFFRMTLTPS